MITFQIYLSASTVKEALKYRNELIAAGVKEDAISFPAPSVMRSAAPAANKTASLAQLETMWRDLPDTGGKNFRCTPNMIAMFGLPNDREGQLRQMISLVESGLAIKTATGWQPSNGGGNVSGPREQIEIDEDEVV